MSKFEGSHGRLEPPKRDYKPARNFGERPSLWQRLFGKRDEPHKQVRTVATQPKHHVAPPTAVAKGGGDQAAPVHAGGTSRRAALAALAGVASFPAAAAAAAGVLDAQSRAMQDQAKVKAVNDLFAEAYRRNAVYTTFAPGTIITTSPLHELPRLPLLDAPAEELPDWLKKG